MIKIATVVLCGMAALGETASREEKEKMGLNTTTGGPYTYDQSKHHFYGVAYDGSYIDTKAACAGANDECRNNPDCECVKNEGPLPQGSYTLGDMFTYKGYPYSYQIFPDASNDMCGRSDFLIHGGNCGSGNPSIGCIVIEDESTRYMIKSGARLNVVH